MFTPETHRPRQPAGSSIPRVRSGYAKRSRAAIARTEAPGEHGWTADRVPAAHCQAEFAHRHFPRAHLPARRAYLRRRRRVRLSSGQGGLPNRCSWAQSAPRRQFGAGDLFGAASGNPDRASCAFPDRLPPLWRCVRATWGSPQHRITRDRRKGGNDRRGGVPQIRRPQLMCPGACRRHCARPLRLAPALRRRRPACRCLPVPAAEGSARPRVSQAVLRSESRPRP